MPKAIAIAVAACFAADGALANPTGATVISGNASVSQRGNLLSIINTPGAIINWRGFSIGANEITRFIQQSASSSVLNRVVGIDPSIILGTLQSNGRVFLINPNGVLFGAGSRVDVAGLVASTLNLSNGDFLAGRMRFTDTPGAGSVVNQGTITTPSGGQVYLIAPNVQNSGIINSPQGEVILAAGKTVEIVDSGTPNLRVELTASDNEALNVGQIIANSGRIGIYAGLIRNGGAIRADGVVVGANGEILLKATRNTTLEAGSTLSASGAQGGNITVQSGDTTLVEGNILATGSEGGGGNVKLLGNLVGLTGNTTVDVSGQTGGGVIMVGGDFQGKNPDIQNAWRTYVGRDVMLRADAGVNGDGGKVIVWSDDTTSFLGSISARGGTDGGDGGFAEVSGKNHLDFVGRVDLRAPKGRTGTLLLDPNNVTIGGVDGGEGQFSGGSPNIFDSWGTMNSTISWATINSNISSADLIITTSGYGSASGDITIASAGSLNTPNTFQLVAHNSINVDASVSNTGTGDIRMYAGWDGNMLSVATPSVNWGVGNIAVNAPVSTLGNVVLVAGNGVSQTAAGVITANGLAADGRAGAVNLAAASNMVNTVAGSATGDFNFKNARSLTVGNVGGYYGVTADGGEGVPASVAITVTGAGNTLTVNESIRANDNGYYNDAANIALTSPNGITINGDGVEGNIGVFANGGYGNIGDGGAATITLAGGSGPILLDSYARVKATGGGSDYNGGNAQIDITTTDKITIQANSGVHAQAGWGGTYGAGDGGIATVNLTSGALGIKLDNSAYIEANGGGSSSGMGGAATIALNAGSGPILLDNGAYIHASGGYSDNDVGGAASIVINARSIKLDNNSSLTVDGGDGYRDGGIGTIMLTSSGAAGIVLDNGAYINAYGGDAGDGGEGSATGGAAMIALTANGSGGINMNNGSSVYAGGGAGYYDANGGDATVTLTSGSGGIRIENLSTVTAQGGAGADGAPDYTGDGGAGLVALTTSGGISILSGAGVRAFGGNGGNYEGYGNGGAATVNISSGATGITIDGAEGAYSSGGNGGYYYGFGGNAAINLNGGSGPILLTNFASLEAQGGPSNDSQYGGAAAISLTTAGSITVDSSSWISAYGGGGYYGTGLASVSLSGGAGVTLSNAAVTVDGAEGASIAIVTPAGNIDLAGSTLMASSDGSEGGGTASILLSAPNGWIHGAGAMLQASNANTGFGNNPLIEMRAKSGIGEIGSPIVFLDPNDEADIIAINNGPTGDIAIGQATGDVVIDSFSNIINYAPGYAIDLTALAGNVTVATTVSNPYGSLTVRSGQAGGYIRVDGSVGGLLTTGSGGGNDISLIADDIDLIAPSGSVVKSGSGLIKVNTLTPGRAIWLGSSGFLAGQLELTDAELNAMTDLSGSGGALVIGTTGGAAGPLIFKGAVNSSAYLNVRGSSIAQVGGATITGGLNVIADGNVTLTDTGNQITDFSTGSTGTVNINVTSAAPVLNLYDIDASGNIAFTSVGGAIANPGGDQLNAGGTVSLTAANGIGTTSAPMIVNSAGAGSSFTNNGSGDIAVLSMAPTFTVGGGGASVHNTGGGGYYLSAANNMVVNSGSANDAYAQFFAPGSFTTNGYASSDNVLITAGSVTFNGATIGGNLGVLSGGTVHVNSNVTANSIGITAGSIEVNGANFDSTGGSFSGYTTGDVIVSGGGRIYGNPDVNLTVGGNVQINGAGSKIVAESPNSIHILFPLLSEGGYMVNGVRTVWDELMSSGFFINSTSLPAVLGQSLIIDYGIAGLPQAVMQAINTTIASINDSAPDDKDEENNKDGKGEKTVTKGLELQCK